MNENSPICARLAEIVKAVDPAARKRGRSRHGGGRLADDDDRDGAEHRPAERVHEHHGSSSMPTETKNSTAKASRSGRDLRRRLLAEVAFAQHHAGEEGAQRNETSNSVRRAVGDAEGDGEDGETEQLARSGSAPTWCISHGMTRRPTISMIATKTETLAEGDSSENAMRGWRARRCPPSPRRGPAAGPAPAPWRGPRRSAEPTRDAAAMGLEDMTIPQGADQNDAYWRRRARGQRREPATRSSSRAPRERPAPSTVATAI